MLQIDKRFGYAWVWRFLVTKDGNDITIGYYPDYENCTFEFMLRWWRK